MIRRPPRSTLDRSSAASDVYKRQHLSWDLSDVEMVNLIPQVGAGFRLSSNQNDVMGGWNECTHSIRYRTGREVILSTLEFEILRAMAVSYTHLRAHETVLDLVCRLLLEKKKIIIHHT